MAKKGPKSPLNAPPAAPVKARASRPAPPAPKDAKKKSSSDAGPSSRNSKQVSIVPPSASDQPTPSTKHRMLKREGTLAQFLSGKNLLDDDEGKISTDAVIVAVRCRPFNARELKLGSPTPVVEFKGDGHTLVVEDVAVSYTHLTLPTICSV